MPEIEKESSLATTVLPTCYFGPLHWYAAAIKETKFFLEVFQHYKKQTYSSRTYIKTANNIIPLVIPVGRKGVHIPVAKKRISYAEKWQQNHWRSLTTAYKNSPYFEYYADTLKSFYQQEYEYLADLQLASLQIIEKALKLDFSYTLTTTYEDEYLNDYRKDFVGKREQLPSWFQIHTYPQVFEGFSPALSILDLLFNEGPASTILLRDSFSKKS